ncbi:alkaline phosphatase family protein [Paenibacillus senegalensis]|uniref:alkaline phosphatase family protein n=1 Tax=Paenibacillus senegalensis TaxID=1465766 RepID=UPI000289CC3E|nr:alkaline phosphatase family protein [Paenibacillus senegalensis]
MRRLTAASLILFIFLCTIGFGCQGPKTGSQEQDLAKAKSISGEHSKKTIFLLIDSLMAKAIDQGIEQKELPNFQFLIEHGQYYKDMVSSFPTMSVTIDSSLLTGTYPNQHHVPGLTWYSMKEKKMINYGTGPMEVIKHGIDPTLTDALIHLNGKHLNPELPTLYDDLAKLGLKAGSVNGLLYRGPQVHVLQIPPWIQGPTSLPEQIGVKGPDFLALGALSDPLADIENKPDGITRNMGINNKFSLETVEYLITENKLPDFLFVYLPDLDRRIHKKGPADLKGVKKVDDQLNALLQRFGSPQEALAKVNLIIAGDSGMTQLKSKREEPVIDLPSMFGEYNVLLPGENVTDDTDIVLAVNETMAYLYNLRPENSLREIALRLAGDSRIDLVSWRENDWIHAIHGGTAKELKYKAGGTLVDPYQQKWTVEQDIEVLDLAVNPANLALGYGRYPDVLQRLSGALHSHPGEYLVVTAKPGYELTNQSSPTHEGGGGHGSLHKEESLVPLIIAGTDLRPQYLRIVDLKPFLLKLLTAEQAKSNK